MTTIHPTNTCFDDALDTIEAWFFEKGLKWLIDEKIVIVHAICLIPEGQNNSGELYTHAWIEWGDRVYLSGIIDGTKIGWSALAEEYRRLQRIQKETKYPVLKALQMNWQSNHYGPWEPEYIQYVRGRK